ncbi:MAG TPA: sensor domain-containing diguanylate cyclase [Thermoleophilaceae bacterium]
MRDRPPSSTSHHVPFGNTAEALHAVRLLLEATPGPDPAGSLPERVLGEARQFFRMSQACLLRIAGRPRQVQVSAIVPPAGSHRRRVSLDDLGPVADLSGSQAAHVVSEGAAAELCAALGLDPAATLLLLPIETTQLTQTVAVLASRRPRELGDEQLDVAEAFAAAAGAVLSRGRRAAANATQSSRQVELSRAARSLNASLDLNRVLVRICEESARILAADTAVVYMGDRDQGLRLEAGTGVGPDAIGIRLAAGEGLAGRVAEAGEAMLTNDYGSLAGTPAVYSEVRRAMAVPLRWDDALHGVLSLGWKQGRRLRSEHLELLTAFGEIAASACRNANTHERLVTAARTDALTGCLNQAALHDTLRRELDRCDRSGQTLSLAIVDMDDFKQVNERHGHLAGDEVLRRVGRALRRAVRPYDVVGRYGGDEFAILAIDTGEADAREIAARAIERVASDLADIEASTGATAGVAERQPGDSPTDLIERADRALLYGKHEGVRGTALCASSVPQRFSPSGSARSAPDAQVALSESR